MKLKLAKTIKPKITKKRNKKAASTYFQRQTQNKKFDEKRNKDSQRFFNGACAIRL